MSSRKYNRRIEVYEFGTPTDDGFGGSISTDSLVSKSWALIESYNVNRFGGLEAFGVLNPDRTYLVTVRKRLDLEYNPNKHYVKYRNKTYTILSTPINKDFNDKEISFFITESDD